jgi:phosphatidylglycerol lysyltransferase
VSVLSLTIDRRTRTLEEQLTNHSSQAPGIERVRELVLEYGWNATSYQIVNPGIEHWFSEKGDAVVGFVEASGFRIAAGAPVCDESRLADVAGEFERDAEGSGLRVCYFGAEERLESLYRDDAGHSMVLLGAQPVWNPSNWASMLANHASLRAQLNRARNKKVKIVEWAPERATGAQSLRNCLDEWLATKGLPPLHFLVEPQTLSRLTDRRIFVAERGEQVVGFLVASPIPRREGWLIEQNIRAAKAPNGTAELLIDGATRAMDARNSHYVTLGLSPLSRRSGVESTSKNPLWLRTVLSWVRAHGKRFYNFEGLDAFKAKFRPERWEPVYAIANQHDFSFKALYAIASAFSQGSPISTITGGILRAAGTEMRWLIKSRG